LSKEMGTHQHNKGDGAKYTKQRRPVKIIYREEYNTVSEAMKREAQVKRWRRDKKEKLINNNNALSGSC